MFQLAVDYMTLKLAIQGGNVLSKNILNGRTLILHTSKVVSFQRDLLSDKYTMYRAGINITTGIGEIMSESILNATI